MTEISTIDRQIDAIHDTLKSKYPALRRTPKLHYGPSYLAACHRWQLAWDAHPELRAQELELYRQRGDAQLARDEKAHKTAMRIPRAKKPKKCPTCGCNTLAA